MKKLLHQYTNIILFPMPLLILGIPLVKLLFAIAFIAKGVEECSDSIKEGKANRKANSKSAS